MRSATSPQDPRYGKMGPHHGMPKGHLPVRSYLAVPVISRSGEVIGGLFFGHPDTDVFTERAERIVVGVAGQAAVAIDNARLYEVAQKAAEERKRLLESERAARNAAERMSEMKDDFLATLSHELRTPLNAILGWAQVLRRGAKNEADLQQGLEAIERNARVQTQLIEDLLDMSRITSGKVRLDIQPIAPVTFIEAAVETVQAGGGRQRHPAREVSRSAGRSDLGRSQPPAAGDVEPAVQRDQVHAARAVEVQVLLERVNSHIEINVADTGIGIKPEFLPHVFERFRQADASTTRKLRRARARAWRSSSIWSSCMAATVRVEQRRRRSGHHLRRAPAVDCRPSARHRPRHALHPTTPTGLSTEFKVVDLAGIKVLVVDDEPDARDLLKRVLMECNATCRHRRHGRRSAAVDRNAKDRTCW